MQVTTRCLCKRTLHLLGTLSPLEKHLLCERDSRIIVRHLASSSATRWCSEGNAVVDIQDARCAARRPNNRSILDNINLGVNLAIEEVRPVDRSLGAGRVGCILGEIVC